MILPGDVEFVGTLYSFGATLSFTIAHAVDRPDADATRPTEEVPFRARPNLRIGAVDWPLFAVFGGIATGISFLVILVQNPATRWAGLGLARGRARPLRVYRRRVVGEPLAATVKAPPAYGPALALEYRRLLVPVLAGQASDDALDVAASLSAERGARITAVSVLEIPLDLPLGAELTAEEELANRELDEARAIGESYGVSRDPAARPRPQRRRGDRARRPSGARAEIIVIGAPRKDLSRRKRAVFGRTVDYVLKNAPCRVLVTATTEEAA